MRSDMAVLTKKMKRVLAPVHRAEEQRAIRAAVAKLQAQADFLPDARIRVLGAELAIDKPPTRSAVPTRTIRVLIADYSGRRIFEARVSGRSVEGRTLSDYQPAFHRDEIKEARHIAEQDARIAKYTKGTSVRVIVFSPERGSDRGGTRLVGLHLLRAGKRGEADSPLVTAVVDLCGEVVLSHSDDRAPGQPGQRHPR